MENNFEEDSEKTNSEIFSLKINSIKNPMINRFNTNSFFIYDITEYKKYIENIKDLNRLKLTDKECLFLKKYIEKSKVLEGINNKNLFVTLDKSLVDELFNSYKKPIERSPLELFLLEEYSKSENRANFTCRKLSRKFMEITNQRISKSTINNILKNKFGFKWKKTVIKNSKTKRPQNIMMSLVFIKIILRSMVQQFNIIYCDESAIQSVNNHLKIWKSPEEEFYAPIAHKTKYNLIMSISAAGIIHYNINIENTTTNKFLEYMKELVEIINKKNIRPYLIVLDNLSVHKTKDLLDFYKSNKVNIVFNSPYVSKFNAIEYTFRDLKKILYSKIYEDEEVLIKDVKHILNSESFNKKTEINVREACINYLGFYNEQKSENLNNILFLK